MTRVLLMLVTIFFVACKDRIVETPKISIVQASDAKIAEVRSELRNGPLFSTSDIWATNGNIVVSDQYTNRTIEVRFDGKEWTDQQRVLLQTGTNLVELRKPWAEPIRRVYIGKSDKVAFEVQVRTDFTKSQIIMARISGNSLVSEFVTTGRLLLANQDRTKFAYLRTDPDVLSGRHSLHYVSDEHVDLTLLSLTDSDPGSGRSFDYFWLRSDCLYIAGTAKEIEPKPIPMPHKFELVYCPPGNELINVRR